MNVNQILVSMEIVPIKSTDTFVLVMLVTMAIIVRQVFDLFCLSYLYIYLPDLHESDGGPNTYPTCFRRCQVTAARLKFNRDVTEI